MSRVIRTLRAALPHTGRVLRAFLPRVLPHRWQLAGAFGLGVIATLAEILKPWPLQVVFDFVLVPPTRAAQAAHGPFASLVPWIRTLGPGQVIGIAAAAVLLVTLAGGVAEYGRTLLTSRVGQRLVARLRRDLMLHLLRLDPMYHASRRQGDLLMRLTGDIVLLRELLVGGMLDIAAALLVLAGTLAVMLWMHAGLTLLSLAIVPVVALAGGAFGGRIRRAVRRNRDKEGALAALAGEALGTIPLLQSFGASAHVLERFERGNRSSLRSGMKAARLEAMLARALDLLTAAGTAVTLALGAWIVQRGELTPGGLLVFLAYQRTLYRPVRQLARTAVRAAKSAACGERVLDVLETAPAIADPPGALPCPGVRGSLSFDGVGVCYPRGDVALEGVSLEVPAGAVCVIRGESGAGKSTLLALIPRLLDPTHGVVRADGVDVRAWTLDSWREQIAVVFQDAVLLGMSVRENIALGRPDATPAEVEEAAFRGGVMRFADDLPDGLDTVVGERGAQLSGGQRQRVALARAALRHAPILVLDEPFAHLDDVSRGHVLAALREVARGRTVLLVTHDEDPGLDPDIEVTLASGRVIAVAQAEGAAAGAGREGVRA